MPATPEEIGQLIREIRKRKGLTQKEMGEKMGVTESTFNGYEKGKQNLTLLTLQKIAESLGGTFEVIFKDQ